jgi:hypothetical protein
MTLAAPSCPKCGAQAAPGARFCAACGAALEVPRAAAARPRSLPAPDRLLLQGPCTLLYAGGGELDIRRVGRLVAEAVKRPLSDVTRELRNSRGFIAKGLPAPAAAALAAKVEAELAAPVLVVADADCIALPPAMRIRDTMVTADGLRCEAYAWDQTERVAAQWDEVFLISCGRLEIEHAVETAEDLESVARGRMSALVMEKRYEFLIDVVLFEPWRRLRLDQNTTAFSLTEMRRGPEDTLGALFRCAFSLRQLALGVPMNRGIELLASGGSDVAWQPLTFLNKRDFETYTSWLMQLLRYGRQIPA